MERMNRMVLLLLILLVSGWISAVPEKAINAFKTRFPGAEKVKWEQESKSEWEANFYINKQKMSAGFNDQGDWLETEWVIEFKDCSLEVKNSIGKLSDWGKVIEVERIEKADGTHNYEVEFLKGLKIKEVKFSSDGKILN